MYANDDTAYSLPSGDSPPAASPCWAASVM